MKEIPLLYVRANQWGLVLSILLTIVLGLPAIVIVVLLIQSIGLRFGVKYNLFVQIAKLLQIDKIKNKETESAEIQRFNNSIAVTLLSISSILYLIHLSISPEAGTSGLVIASLLVAGMVACAAFLAICGYCIGCKIYYRIKRLTTR